MKNWLQAPMYQRREYCKAAPLRTERLILRYVGGHDGTKGTVAVWSCAVYTDAYSIAFANTQDHQPLLGWTRYLFAKWEVQLIMGKSTPPTWRNGDRPNGWTGFEEWRKESSIILRSGRQRMRNAAQGEQACKITKWLHEERQVTAVRTGESVTTSPIRMAQELEPTWTDILRLGSRADFMGQDAVRDMVQGLDRHDFEVPRLTGQMLQRCAMTRKRSVPGGNKIS